MSPISLLRHLTVGVCLLAIATAVSAQEKRLGEVASADGTVIRYETRGEGSPAIVFLHGWCCNRTFWEPQLEFFAKQRQVVAIDLAGHGQSDGGRKDYTMAAFGQDVAAMVRNLKLKKVIIVGHSMGGPVLLEAAALLKDEVSGLIAVDAFTDPDEAYTYQQITDYCKPFQDDFPKAMKDALLHEEDFFRKETDQKLIDQIIPVMTAASPEIGHRAFLGMLDFANCRQRPLMSQVKVPFLCINAKRDEQKVKDGQKHAPQFEVVTLPNSGHFLMMEHPEEFNELLQAQLQPPKVAAVEDDILLDQVPSVVVKTIPEAGAADVDPAITEIKVTYSKTMADGSWSWSTYSKESFPKTEGEPKYLDDKRTCVLPVKLEPGKTYALWLNSSKFKNFKDAEGRPAVPYLLVFKTKK